MFSQIKITCCLDNPVLFVIICSITLQIGNLIGRILKPYHKVCIILESCRNDGGVLKCDMGLNLRAPII